MVVGILKTIELEPGDELVAVNWHVSRSMNFKEIVARSENDTTNLRVIVFSDITPKYGEEWYGRAMIRTRLRGWGTWISVDIITLNREDSLNNIVALPSPISLPNLITTKYALIKDRNPKTDIGHSNHPLTNFYLNAENSFKTIGDAKLVATSWWIEDVNDQVVWKRLFDTKNLYSVKFSGLLLEREKIYRARAVFHSNTQDSSDPSSYRFKTIGDYNYALRVFLENQFFNKLNNPGFDEEGTPIQHPLDTGFNFTLPYEPTVTDRWIEIHKVENGDISEVFKVHLTDGNRDVNIAPGTLEKNAEYLIFFKTKEDDPLDTIVLNTYEYNYEEVLPEGEPDTPDHDITNPVPDTPIKLWCKQMAEVGEEVHIVATGTYKLVNFTFVPNSVTVVDKTMHKVTIRLNKMEDVKVIASGMGIPEVSRTIKVGARQEAADTPQVDTGSGGPTDVTYHPDKNTYNPGDRVVVVGPFGSQGVFLDPETGGKVTEIAPGVFEVVFGDNLGQVSISVLPGFNRDKTIEVVAKQEVSITPQEPTDRPITYVPSKDTYDYNDKIIVTGPAGTTGIELEPASHLADVVEIGDGVFEITIKHPTDLTPVFKPSNKKGDVIKTTKDDDLYLDLLHINLGDFLYKYCTDFDYARRKTGYVLSGSEDMFTEQTFLNKIKEVNFYNQYITNVDNLPPLSLPITWGCLINNAFIPFFDKEYFKENVVREDGVVDWYLEGEKDPTIKAKYRLVDPDKHWDKIKELNTKMVRDRDQTYADNFLNNDRWGLLDIKGLKTNQRTASLKNAKEYLSKLARSTMGMSYVPNCKFVLEEKFAREHPQAYYEILNYVDIDEQGNFSLIDPKTKHPRPYRKLVELVTASDGNYRNGAFQPGGNYSNGVIHEYLKFISAQLVAYHAVSGFYHNGVVNNIDDIVGPYSFIQAVAWIRYYGSNSPTIRNNSDMDSFMDSVPITSGNGFPLLWRFLPKQFEPPKIPGEEEIFTQDQIVDRRPVINIEDLEPLPPEEEVEEEQPPKELTEAEINNILDYDLHQLFNWALASEENTEEFINFYYEGATGHFLPYAIAEQQWCSKIQDYTDIEKRIWMIYNCGMYVSYLMYSKKYRNTLNPSTRSGFTLAVSDPQVLGENLKEFMKGAIRGQLDQEDLLEPVKSISTSQQPGPEVGAIIEKENGVLTTKYQEDGCTIVNAREGAGFFAVFWRYHLASLIKSNCDSDRLTLMLFGEQDHTGATRPAAKCPIKAETFKDYTLAPYSGSSSGSVSDADLSNEQILNLLDVDFTDFFNWALGDDDNIQAVLDSYYVGTTGVSTPWETFPFSSRTATTDIEKKIGIISASLQFVGVLLNNKEYRKSLKRSTRDGFNMLIDNPEKLLELNKALQQQFNNTRNNKDPKVNMDDYLEYTNLYLNAMFGYRLMSQQPTPEMNEKLMEQTAKEHKIINGYLENKTVTVQNIVGNNMAAISFMYHVFSLVDSNETSSAFKQEMYNQWLRVSDRTDKPNPFTKAKQKNYRFDPNSTPITGTTHKPGSGAGKPAQVPRYEPVEENWPLYINPYKLNIVNQFSRLIARPEETLEIAKTFVNQATGNNERFAFTDFEGMMSSAFFNYGPYVKKHKNLKTSEEDLNAAYLFTISEMIFKMVFYRDNFTKNVTADTVEGYFKWNVVNNFLKAMKSYAGKYAWAESGYHEHMKKAYIYSISQFDYSNSWTGDGGASGHNHSKFFDMLKFLYGNENVEPYLTTNPSNGNMALKEEGWTKSYLHPTKGGTAIMMKNIDDIEELFTLDKTYFTNLSIASAIESNYSEEFKQKYKDYDLRYRHQVFYQQRTAKKYYSWILPMYYAILQTWKSINMYRASKGQVQIPELKLTKAVVAQALLQSRDSVDNPELIYIPKLDLIKPRVDSLDKEIFPD